MAKLKMMLVLILSVLIMLAGNVYASTEKVKITSSKSEVEVGNTFEITISASHEEAIDGLSSKVEYNKNVLEVVSSELIDNENWSDLDTFPNLVAVWKTIGSETSSADIYKVTFKVKDNITSQDTEIKLSDVILSHTNGQDNLEDIIKTIKIKTKENTTDNGNNNNNGDNDKNDNVGNDNNDKDSNKSDEEQNTSNEEKGEADSSENKGVDNNNLTLKAGSAKTSDTTTSEKDMPFTGELNKVIVILIFVFLAFGINGYVLYKKYKDI